MTDRNISKDTKQLNNAVDHLDGKDIHRTLRRMEPSPGQASS